LSLETSGARRGEVLGLRWSDVDLDAKRAIIRHTVTVVVDHPVMFGEPNTARGCRSIALDAGLVAVLRNGGDDSSKSA
jgi:integrase